MATIGGGLLAGVGQAIIEDGKAKREGAMAELERQFRTSEREAGHITGEACEKILWKNADRLLGLGLSSLGS